MTRLDPWFAAILFAALVLRLFLASTQPYLHDEINTAIPLADTISFTPGQLSLPLRGENHGALPAYVVHASRSLFGTSPVGSRALHLLLGLLTIGLVYALARTWFGATAGRWAAALMAFNEFYLDVSSRATAHVPHLLLAGGAIYGFSRFLAVRRPIWLYAAGVSLGLAFYCKEHSALLLPVFFATLLLPPYREWLKRPAPYVACAVWLLVVSPDLLWNARTDESRVNYAGQVVAQATYSRHLQRIGGLGLSAYPSMFYGRSVVTAAHQAALGRELRDETPEYPAMNPLIGLVMLGGIIATTARARTLSGATPFFLLAFWGIFAFFTFIEKGSPPGRLDPVSWIWVEVTLIPAAVVAGARLAELSGTWRLAAWGAAGAALAFACSPALTALFVAAAAMAQEGYAQTSHAVQVALEWTVAYTRERPLRALAAGVGIGVLAGGLVGIVLGRRGLALSSRLFR